jgi:CheY-like chemotaxis protein
VQRVIIRASLLLIVCFEQGLPVPVKILLADDSMTAQNMGKKILSEGGYEVVVVSNGSAALKKIAEHKPEIVILDIYMPGYSGLEVCERLKSTMESAKVPVLLSVGKLEPFRPEDAVRVRAEGVIIKPFEATELLAAVERAAGHIVKRAPVPQATPYEPEPEPFTEEFVETNDGVFSSAEMTIPDEVANSPVFGIDESVSAASMDSFDSLHDPMPSFIETALESFGVARLEEHVVAGGELDDPREASADLTVAEQVAEAETAEPQPQTNSDFKFAGTEETPAEEAVSSEVPEVAPPEFPQAVSAAADVDPLFNKPDAGGPISSNLEPEMFVDNFDSSAVVVTRDPNLWLNDSITHAEMLPEVEVTAQEKAEPVDAPVDPALIAREELMVEIKNFPPIDPEDDLVCESDVARTEVAAAAEEAVTTSHGEEPVQAEDDFEALVSAALAKFEPEPASASAPIEQHSEAVAATSWRAEQAALDQSERTLSLEREMQIALAVASGGSSVGIREVPSRAGGGSNGNGAGASYPVEAEIETVRSSVESRVREIADDAPAVTSAFSVLSDPESEKAVAEVGAEPEPNDSIEQASQVQHDTQEGMRLPELAASAAAGVLSASLPKAQSSMEQERLVEAIGRVLERLKPQIVSELVKELKDEK